MSSVTDVISSLSDIGVDRRLGGWSRPVFSSAELSLREWFIEQATRRGLDVEIDGNQIIWAWWGPPGPDALVTGSHLDSVPGGGEYDGPLGVASALLALDQMRANGFQPNRPFALAVFPEEEGSRFGVACLGSRLLTGGIDPDRVRALTDADGMSFADLARANGYDPLRIGADPQRLARMGAFVELHVEQGIGLGPTGQPVGVAGRILGHGRWRVGFTGQGNHAGATRMSDRCDPMIPAAALVGAVRRIAAACPDARGTVGRFVPVPGGTNVIASRVQLWLDVRHPDNAVTAELVEQISVAATDLATAEGCGVQVVEESLSPTVGFDSVLTGRVREALGGVPVLDTGAGHDAGVLASRLPTAMLFVRNPSGVSHAPEECVEPGDGDAGVAALAQTLTALSS